MSSLLSLRSLVQQRNPCRRVLQHTKGYLKPIYPRNDDSVLLRNLSFFSTTSTSNTTPPVVDRKKTRLPRTLYRQLLRWCQSTGAEMPLTPFIDPFSLSPPQVDPDQLQALKEYHDKQQQEPTTTTELISTVHGLLPPKCRIQDQQLLFQVRNANELKRVIQAMFRLNSASTTDDEDLQKTRIAYAFQTLRTLNELSEALAHLNEHRQDHMTRTLPSSEGGSSSNEVEGDVDILYFVGQVVQHKHERWRGVITGWEKPGNEEIGASDAGGGPMELSSLTTKIYTAGDFLKRVRYEVVLDLADMHTMQATAPLIVSTQEDLEPVTDPKLCRIRSSMVSQNFRGFDPVSNTFIANDLLAYEYPVDLEIQQQQLASSIVNDKKKEDVKEMAFAVDVAAKETVSNIQALMDYLEHMIVLPDDQEERKELDLLRTIKQQLASRDEVGQSSMMFGDDNDDESPLALASAHLRYIFNLTSELRDILWHRKTFQELTLKPKFGVGDIVYHQFFGFRGVVVACDHVPRANVTHWDGVRHIDNALEKPFYRVIPDEQDVEEAFGGPRGMRYICEDNLVHCDKDRTSITVKLDLLEPGWSRELDSQGKTVFVPSSRALFQHGGDIGDEGLTEDLLKKIHDELRLWQLASRDVEQQGESSAKEGIASFRLSLPGIFLLLESVATLDGAEAIELMIKDMFKVHPKENLHRQLEKGLTEMMRGKHDDALEIFKSLVEEDSQYAEAWNWLATCDFLKGRHSSSLESAVKALELQPMNFQSQSGIGLCLYDLGKYEESADAFRQCLDLNPWSPVSTKLSACTDILDRRKSEDSKENESEKET